MSASLALTLRRLGGPSQQIAYTGTAGVIATKLPASCNAVMCWISTQGYIAVGAGSTLAATTTDCPMPAGMPVIFPVERPTGPGLNQDMYVSAIRDSASGTLYVQPLAD